MLIPSIGIRLASWTFFFFNDTATTEIYTLSLHDALPISTSANAGTAYSFTPTAADPNGNALTFSIQNRSEEHTSELQSQSNLVCRLLLEKKTFSRIATSLSMLLADGIAIRMREPSRATIA